MNRTAKAVAVVQSCYVPWKGYFDLIGSVDEFVLYDDVQYTRRDWRNRNVVKTPQGPLWLTIPVRVKGRYRQRIDETEVSEPAWAARHWKTIVRNYAPAAWFADYCDLFEGAYREAASERLLSRINRRFVDAVCDVLSIGTTVSWSSDYLPEGVKTERLVSLCRQAGATRYLSGPSARSYLDESLFAAAGIEVAYFDYSGYPEYPQLHPPFDHHVSVLDLIFNAGPEARRCLKARSPVQA